MCFICRRILSHPTISFPFFLFVPPSQPLCSNLSHFSTSLDSLMVFRKVDFMLESFVKCKKPPKPQSDRKSQREWAACGPSKSQLRWMMKNTSVPVSLKPESLRCFPLFRLGSPHWLKSHEQFYCAYRAFLPYLTSQYCSYKVMQDRM